tara:strand:+ start:3295 stop:3999 length:705 start_codon:yes stop_codon:yes gene_type:complete
MARRSLSFPESWKDLLIGGEKTAIPWTDSLDKRAIPFCLITIVAGVGIYGASIGLWQGPKMALFVAIKLPLVIAITLLLNGLFNGILAQLLGSRLSFAQTTLAVLTAFSVFAIIVGSLSPITLGMAWDAPAPDSPRGPETHRRLILIHTGIIAFAGLASTYRLHRLLRYFTSSTDSARNCLIGLISGNLFLGAQISFLMRPIFGHPGLKIEFLRPDMFEGNFYESIWWALKHSF